MMRRNTKHIVLSVITILSLFITVAILSSCNMQLDTLPSEEESEKTEQAEIEDTAEQTVEESPSEDSYEDKKRIPEIDGTINKDEYKYSQVYEEMEVYWTNDKKNIYIGMKVRTEGYVSIAVQPGEKMKNADLILGFVKDNQTSIIDMYSNEDFGPHITDDKLGGENSIIEFSGSEENGSTSIEFVRLLDTGDKYDNILSKGDNQIIWAYSNLDDPESKHTKRGYGQIKID